MSRKYSLSYFTIQGTAPVDHIRIAAEAGYDLVSLRIIPMNLLGEPSFLMHKDPVLLRDTKTALREYGMRLMDIELARIGPNFNMDDYKYAFEAAYELGASDVIGSVWTRNKPWYLDATAKVAGEARKCGLCFNLEFLPWAGVRNLQEAITVVDTLQMDNLFILVDTLHAGRAGVTAEEIKRTDKRYFRFMHLCDAPNGPGNDPVLDNIKDEFMLYTAREGRCYLGEGDFDIAGMVGAIPGVPLSIELPNLKEMNARGVFGHAKRCLETAKEYFSARGIE